MTYQWVPQNIRVQRLSDGKIFSNSLGAARHHKLPIAREIEDCCERLIASDTMGEKWSWCFKKPVRNFGDIDNLIFRIRKELKENYGDEPLRIKKNHYKQRGKATNPQYRQVAYVVGSFIRDYISSEYPSGDSRMSTMRMYKRLLGWCHKNGHVAPVKSYRGLGRHLRSWEILYAKLCGLYLVRDLIVNGRKRIGIAFNKELIVEGFSVYDPIQEYATKDLTQWSKMPVRPGARGYPVFCENTGITYPSITAASRDTMVYRSEIKFCCEGDVDCFEALGQVWFFSYSRWEEVDTEWFVGKKEWAQSAQPRQVILLNDGTIYNSITEAARISGVDRRAVVDFCERGDSEGQGLAQKESYTGIVTHWRFKYYDPDEEEW